MRNIVLVLGFAAFLTVPSWAQDVVPAAQPTVAAVPATPAPTAVSETDATLNAVVCKKMAPPTGTMLGARKVCMTNKEWRDRTAANQRTVTDMQQKGLGIVPGN